MKKRLTLLLLVSFFAFAAFAQDTVTVQTLTYDSTGRSYVFQFPEEDGTTYEKIIMEYSMRCKGALVSIPTDRNRGCGEWDYSCNTFVRDSSMTDSIRATHPSHIIAGFSGTTFDYTTNPTYSYHQYIHKDVVYNSVTSETVANIGAGSEALSHPFGTAAAVSKAQYLWTAAELSAAGLTAGDITSLRLNISSVASAANFLRIRMKHTSQTELSAANPELDGFTEVYFINAPLELGENNFRFYQAFDWNGSSNLLVEMSFTNALADTDNSVMGHEAGFAAGLVSQDKNYGLEFTGSESILLPETSFANISDEITISMWYYGNPDILPANTTAFEGTDNQNRRQVNVHLPWSNSQVYWDCGSDGNYDRINQPANNSDFAGQWNHWAFTKNTHIGSMNIYLNGNLWHSGGGLTKDIDLRKFKIGGSLTGNNQCFATVDEFRIWNKELSQSEIAEWMHRSIDANHPSYANLLADYAFNEGSGNTVNDASPASATANIEGVAKWSRLAGSELFTHFESVSQRPNVGFVQGVYDISVTDVVVVDTVLNYQTAIVSYGVQGTDIVELSTQNVWPATYEYTYDESGNAIDSSAVTAQGTIEISSLDYYRKFPMDLEIMSFVTPYGIYLDLGEEGKTWAFDVTDFTPILKGKKLLWLGNGGQFQEEMDIRFLFIKGTPPRDVISIQQIWEAGRGHGFTALLNDDAMEPRSIVLRPDASMFKVRAAITGHGQQGEFTQRTHSINVDGGPAEFQWEVWKECADNPIYPQGGTWIYDRAGWCPGAATDMQEFEITEIVTPGQPVELDYGINAGFGDSRYLLNCQLVSYGEPNFELDARIIDIKRPSDQTPYMRDNPICYNPVVRIQNSGASRLNSLKISYRVPGKSTRNYNWTGSLNFMEAMDVELPMPDPSFWYGDENKFIVTISQPNGGQDEYAANNQMTSTFELPDSYQVGTILRLRTNARGFENNFTIKNSEGDVILSRGGLNNNSTYNDTLNFAAGCYTLELFDQGDDGLEFWNNPGQGEGSLTFRNMFGTIKALEPDFGKRVKYAFVLGTITKVSDPNITRLFAVSPNPNQGLFAIELELEESTDFELHISDMMGRNVWARQFEHFRQGTISADLSKLAPGLYYCSLRGKDWVETRKVMVVR